MPRVSRAVASTAGTSSYGRHDPHHIADDLRLLEAVAVAEPIEVALQPGLEIPLRQREGHLGVLLAVGGRSAPRAFSASRFLALASSLSLFFTSGRDPADVGLGGRWHSGTLEDGIAAFRIARR